MIKGLSLTTIHMLHVTMYNSPPLPLWITFAHGHLDYLILKTFVLHHTFFHVFLGGGEGVNSLFIYLC